MGDLVARATRRTPAKVSDKIMAILCKFFNQFLSRGTLHLFKELVDFHAAKVNPRHWVSPVVFFLALIC